ncbi:MAG: hypothetical protein GXP25_14525 [Planctomycetes bacterium]|nr:hypothetical protein [Planctomycetota bacterium]
MWLVIAKAACGVGGVTALAAASLYALWALCILRGKVLVIRSDQLFYFRIVCLTPFLAVVPTLFACHPGSPLTWAVTGLFACDFFGLARHALSLLYVACYNVAEEDLVLAVRRAFVLAGIGFHEREYRFFDESKTPLVEVDPDARGPAGQVYLLSGLTPHLYPLLAASCMQSEATLGASPLGFALRGAEMLGVGGVALWLIALGIG